MKAMLLAAGRGERMMPLTKDKPKCLLEINGKTLIDYHLQHLAEAGFKEVVINVSYLGELIQSSLGDGSQYDLQINYSVEDSPLETGGGICKALPLLGSEPFLVISTDVFTDFNFKNLKLHDQALAHLIMVDNPPHRGNGDFYFINDKLNLEQGTKLTYSGMGLYHPAMFADYPIHHFKLVDVLIPLIKNNKISAEYFSGKWIDVGTPERLKKLNNNQWSL